MAHESGSVNSFREALVDVRLKSGEAIKCVIDTGFDGALMLPEPFADRLQITVIGRLAFVTVGGARMFAPIGLGVIEWLDETREVEVIFSPGNDALIGTELLAGTSLNIDYVAHSVTISST